MLPTTTAPCWTFAWVYEKVSARANEEGTPAAAAAAAAYRSEPGDNVIQGAHGRLDTVGEGQQHKHEGKPRGFDGSFRVSDLCDHQLCVDGQRLR